MAFTTTLSISDADCASAATMTPAFENLRLKVNVHNDVIMALRTSEITSCALFVSLDSTEEGATSSAKKVFGIESSVGFGHKRELDKFLQA